MSEAAISTVSGVTLKESRQLVIDVIKAKLTPMITSSPGMGKSSMVHSIAKDFGLKLLDERMSTYDPVDINGFPIRNEETGKASFIPMDTFPLEGDVLPLRPEHRSLQQEYNQLLADGDSSELTDFQDKHCHTGWLLFLDEFNSAPRSVQAAAYKLILDRKIGNTRLHEKVIVVAAGNRMTDKAVVTPTGTAMQSRLVWLELESNLDEWLEYARKAKFDHRVTSFAEARSLVNNFNPEHSDKTFLCERTMEFLSRLLKVWGEDVPEEKLPLVTGSIGEGAGREFFAYLQVFSKLVKFDDIVADPKGTKVPDEPDHQYALSGLIGDRMTKGNCSAVMTYLGRMDVQFQILALRTAVGRDDSLMAEKEVTSWLKYHAKEFM